jgi:hypothetical protein
VIADHVSESLTHVLLDGLGAEQLRGFLRCGARATLVEVHRQILMAVGELDHAWQRPERRVLLAARDGELRALVTADRVLEYEVGAMRHRGVSDGDGVCSDRVRLFHHCGQATLVITEALWLLQAAQRLGARLHVTSS